MIDFISKNSGRIVINHSQTKIHFTSNNFQKLTDRIDSTCIKDQMMAYWNLGNFDPYKRYV